MLFTFTNILLVSLTVYRSTASNLLHIAGVRSHYSYALAVFLGEIMKVVLCYWVAILDFKKEYDVGEGSSQPFLMMNERREDEEPLTFESESKHDSGYSLPFLRNPKLIKSSKRIWRETFNKDAWELLIPASLYVIQNNLCLFAAERLLPSIYQSIWQIRLLPTALLTGIFLGKWPNFQRWICLFGIALGVIIMESAEINSPNSKKEISSSKAGKTGLFLGSLALLVASFCSAASVVVLERIFKNGKTNFWVTNLQLSVFSLVPAFVLILIEFFTSDSIAISSKAFIISFWPWVAILIQTGSGILAGLVTKYADGVTNSISGVVSIALTALIDQAIREQKVGFTYRMMILLGISLIISSTWLYSIFPLSQKQSSNNPNSSTPLQDTIALPEFLPTPPLKQS